LLVGPIENERQEELLPQNILDAIIKHPDIIHIPWSDQVEYILAISDILVHASYREGFPNVPLQAAAMECPIICSNIPGNIDIVSNNKTGLWFEVGNQDSLAEKIEYALQNPSSMALYAERIRREVEEKYSREYIHQELLKFYHKKLENLSCEPALSS
ncbi:MAG TPA: glycosyltransferase, partial [Saprospiraceae bacterium]|nr:glycosyltransferase [Saprospiraceae bacterium]